MITTIFGILLILHGLVHLLYLGHTRRAFELSPGLTWPDGAWVARAGLGEQLLRDLASVFLALSAVLFAVGGFALLIRQGWWRPVTLVAAAVSSAVFVLFWDGGFARLADKGGVGVLINLAVIIALAACNWPKVPA